MSALLAGSVAAAAAFPSPAGPRAAASDDPMVLFQKLVPVFQHPRCLNCHGAIDLSTGLGHGGGAIRPAVAPPPGVMLERVTDCDDCHSASPPRPHDWKLAPPIFSFAGKDARALCTLQADFAMSQGVGGYIHHLETDPLIDLAFAGTAAGPIDPPVRPGMTKAEFMDAAAEWLNAGNGSCVAEGTIKETRQMASNEAWNPAPNISSTLLTSIRRTVTVSRVNGQYTAHAEAEGESILRQVVDCGGGTVTIVQTSTYQGSNDGPASVQSTVAPNGQYTITVQGPRETYRERQTGGSTAGCGSPGMAQDPHENELEWPPWRITIKGRLPDPRDRRRLSGVAVRTFVDQADVEGTITSDALAPEYLSSFMNLSTQKGSSIPIEVTTDWNLLYGR